MADTQCSSPQIDPMYPTSYCRETDDYRRMKGLRRTEPLVPSDLNNNAQTFGSNHKSVQDRLQR